jgi:hypothetical protein
MDPDLAEFQAPTQVALHSVVDTNGDSSSGVQCACASSAEKMAANSSLSDLVVRQSVGCNTKQGGELLLSRQPCVTGLPWRSTAKECR